MKQVFSCLRFKFTLEAARLGLWGAHEWAKGREYAGGTLGGRGKVAGPRSCSSSRNEHLQHSVAAGVGKNLIPLSSAG